LIAIWIVIASVINVSSEIWTGNLTVYNILDEAALIVFAFAVIDVSKYLVLEEVLRADQDRKPHQARRALRKLVIIIFTALSLEGLVITIQFAKTDVTKMIYPGILIFVTTLYLIGLGIYQFLNSKAENS
ncbi:MAG: GNAT family acetyltransferase, partial [Chlamydiia bacterium]|nr:GNAT family acetyltransferase [Chlamydiia bacterium]